MYYRSEKFIIIVLMAAAKQLDKTHQEVNDSYENLSYEVSYCETLFFSYYYGMYLHTAHVESDT